jgi:hypothetical protein
MGRLARGLHRECAQMLARIFVLVILSLTSSVSSQLFPVAHPPLAQPPPKTSPARPTTDAFHAPTTAQTTKRLADALAWETGVYVGSYDRFGHHNARWDDDVRAAFGLLASVAADDPARPADASDQAWYLLTRASKAGCDDPLANYELAALSRSDLTRTEAANRMRSTALKLERSKYPLYWRGTALVRAANSIVTSGTGLAKAEYQPIERESTAMLERALAAWPEIVKDRSMPNAASLVYVEELCNAFVRATHRDRRQVFDRAFAAVKAARDASDPLLPVMTAAFFTKYAWDARGTEFAIEVADSAWPDFSARLDEAEKALRAAMALGTGEPAIPQLMMTVVGGSNGDLDEIIPWFRQAVLANPGQRDPYQGMLNWASPKWHGSVEDVAGLARDAVATRNWNIRIPLMVVDAHDELSKLTPNWKAYFKAPFVCDGIVAVYDEFLKRYPDAVYDRATYARRLTYCGRWADAKRQMDLIAPDRLRVGAFGGQAAYEKTVAEIAVHLK